MEKLEDLLLREGYCSKKDIEQVLTIQSDYGGSIGNILLNLGSISDEILVKALSLQFGYELFATFPKDKITKVMLSEIQPEYLIENNIYPITATATHISLALHNPLQSATFSTLKNILNKELKFYLATEEELREVRLLFEEELDDDEDAIFEDEIDKLKELASEAPIIKLINNIFIKAAKQYVSDIHFEAYKSGMRIRFRVDGSLKTVDNISLGLKQAVVARLKLISKMNIAENRLPQDGRITIKVSGQSLDIRSSSVPTAFGESFVLRLLGSDSVDLRLDKMGFHQDNLELLKRLLTKPNGIILTTGPTGSGKTSTLYAALNYIYNENNKIITVEDPVEYQLEGISQIQVKASIDYTFANALRSILRQDPDIIMIGEIRDSETAEIAIQSALTGHLVLSTLHTNSAMGAISRLLDMGMEYFLLKSTILGLMAQRLAKRLCVHCKEPVIITKEINEFYRIDSLKKFVYSDITPCQAVGCRECNGTGYKGRVPVIELVPFNEEVKEKLDKDLSFSDIRSLGYRTLQDDAILKFLEGIISLDEVVKLSNE